MGRAESLDSQNSLEPFVVDEHRLLVGDLWLDLATRSIQTNRGAQLVKLSRNEFTILTLLVENLGRFVPEDDLLMAVAGDESDPQPGIVDAYIKFLRRQLQEARSLAIIEKDASAGVRLRP